MRHLFTKKQILTIPNMLSVFRLLLIPLIIWFYCVHNFYAAVAILIISGVSDVVDGVIARKCNMMSDVGKILDPIADKLTQGILLICLALKYKYIVVLVGIFVLKEFFMALLGCLVMHRKDSVNSAKWYGKANTVMIYSSILILILFPNISPFIVNTMLICCVLTMLGSLFLYAKFYIGLLKK